MTEGNPNLKEEIYTALLLQKDGKLKEAQSEYRKLLRRYPDNADILHLNGVLLSQMGRMEAAVENLTQAAALAPKSKDIHLNLFGALAASDKIGEIERTLRILIELSPDDAFIFAQLGEVLIRQDRSNEAEPYLRHAIDLSSDLFDVWNNLGNVLERQGKFLEAETCFRKTVELKPTRAEAYYNLGNILRQQNSVKDSINALEKAIELDPKFSLGHVHLAFSHFMNGQYKAAWPEYEWRWNIPNFPTPARQFYQPRWQGEPLNGKMIFIHSEQGFGDTLQFCRFIKNAVDKDGKVALECSQELKGLMCMIPGVDQVLVRGEPLPEFDVHVPLLSIPGIFEMSVDEVSVTAPYLHSDSHLLDKWKGKLGSQGHLKIGITWQTNTEQLSSSFKSCPLSVYKTLFEIENVTWISLQKDIPEIDLPLPNSLIDISDSLENFADTAAVIDQLDLVISMDTAVAHLAGALGKSVWLLLSTAGDWRWMESRTDSPWYPTMTIIRQSAFNDWNDVMQRIKPQIEQMAIERNSKAE